MKNIFQKVEFSELEFYKKIWPLIGECIWEAIRDLQPLEFETIKFKYLYKKALRIISSPDLEPISLLLHESFLRWKRTNLYGVFSQFCKLREWSNVALRTETTGKDSSGVIIHSQAVIGGNGGQIGHKTRELAARLRSINIKCDENGKFLQNNNSVCIFWY